MNLVKLYYTFHYVESEKVFDVIPVIFIKREMWFLLLYFSLFENLRTKLSTGAFRSWISRYPYPMDRKQSEKTKRSKKVVEQLKRSRETAET